MKLLLFAAPVLVAASLCAGCAIDQGTGSMGAGPGGTACNDGTVLPPNSNCKVHGGIARPGSPGSSPSSGGSTY